MLNNSGKMISVVMSVYNGQEYIAEAIESILNQTYKNFEFVIIDDGSSDSTLEIIKKYRVNDSRIKVVSRDNKGLVYSLNEGFSLAKGEYVARMDADDVSCLNRLEEQVSMLERSEADVCGCHFYIMDRNGRYLDAIVTSSDEKLQGLMLTRSVPFAHGSVMIRKEFLDNYSLDYSSDLFNKAEDYYLWVRLYLKSAKFVNVDKFLFYYRDIDQSLSKVNRRLNLNHAKEISNFFVKNAFTSIEREVDSLISSGRRLNTFEKEQMSFYLFRCCFRRSFKKNRLMLRMVSVFYVIPGLLRALSYTWYGMLKPLRVICRGFF